MAKLELLNVFLNDRLTAAAQDIFRAVRDMVVEYQSEVLRSKEENERLRRLLNAAVQRLLLQPGEELRPEGVCPGELRVGGPAPSLELQYVQPPEIDVLSESEERSCMERLPRVKEEAQETNLHTDCSQDTRDPGEGNCSHVEPRRLCHTASPTLSPSTASEVKTENNDEQPEDSSSSSAFHSLCKAAAYNSFTPAAKSQRIQQHAKGLLRSSGKPITHILQIKNGKSLKTPPPLHASYPGQRIQRWHPCKECGKAFSFACQLEVHMRWHTKEKPYSCSVCRKSFTTVSMLKRHHRIHTGEKPFRCHVCGKCFNQSAHLNTHFRLHTRERHCKPSKP